MMAPPGGSLEINRKNWSMNASEGGCQEELSRLHTFDHSDHWSVPKSVAGSGLTVVPDRKSVRFYVKGAMMSFIELHVC